MRPGSLLTYLYLVDHTRSSRVRIPSPAQWSICYNINGYIILKSIQEKIIEHLSSGAPILLNHLNMYQIQQSLWNIKNKLSEKFNKTSGAIIHEP